jgi:hypothetical protein
MLTPNFEKIPQELRVRRNWVVWKLEPDDKGKPTKVPYNPARPEYKASTTNPKTWGTIKQAIAAAKNNGFSGIGYVFSPQDDCAGVDLDHCRKFKMAEIDPWARNIIKHFDSYAENSQSETGVHILVKGKVPPGGNKKGNIEVYSEGRYFAMTGHHLKGTPTTIEDRQAELTALHRAIFGQNKQETPKAASPSPNLSLADSEVITKARNARNGAKFDRLMAGDTSEHGGDDSAADLALCSLLAFWTQDPDQIDRIFKTSGLFREKWESRRGSSTYGAMTISKALAGGTETYQGLQGTPQEARPEAEAAETAQVREEKPPTLADVVLPVATFINLDMTPRRTLLTPWLLEASMGMIVGWRGVGKSMFAMGLTQALARGEGFGPWPGGTAIKCLYLDGEMVQTDVAFRLIKLTEECPQNLFIYSDHYANSLGLPSANLLNEDWRKEIKALLLDLEVKLWIVDNIASLAPGIDENSKKDWDPINQFFLDLRYNNIITIFIHHSNKEGEQRGTSGREDNIDFSILLEQPKNYNHENGCNFVVKFKKARIAQSDLHLIGDSEFSLIETPGGKYEWTFASVKESSRVAVLTYLDQGLSYDEITDLVGLTKGRISQIKHAAFKEELISKDGKLTAEGRIYVEQKK